LDKTEEIKEIETKILEKPEEVEVYVGDDEEEITFNSFQT